MTEFLMVSEIVTLMFRGGIAQSDRTGSADINIR
jgi:hypothetical protein